MRVWKFLKSEWDNSVFCRLHDHWLWLLFVRGWTAFASGFVVLFMCRLLEKPAHVNVFDYVGVSVMITGMCSVILALYCFLMVETWQVIVRIFRKVRGLFSGAID